ncbi:MAG: Ig-like domain-containing protein, partial [Draconibacterium sp.]|nr:Ig-like domain-containing protein [Draconibacterium sp.]
MILILRAALFGAAQEAIVVYEGATTNHNVANHPGSTYNWSVYIDFSPDIKAPPDDYEIIESAVADKIQIRWLSAGIYYLKVTETDLKGCENLKALPVRVISNDRTIGFMITASNSCNNKNGNGFEIPVVVTDNNGSPLTSDYYPLVVEFFLNNTGYSQLLTFENQTIRIENGWLGNDFQSDNDVKIEITKTVDVFGNLIQPADKYNVHQRTIFARPEMEFVDIPAEIYQGTTVDYQVKLISGEPVSAKYTWEVIPANGTSTDLNLIDTYSAGILWDGPPGSYTIQGSVTDGNNCLSEIISKPFTVIEMVNNLPQLFAGYDFFAGYEGTTIAGDLGANDFAASDDEYKFVYSLAGEPVEGLKLNSDGTFIYNALSGFAGKISFTARVCYEENTSVCETAEVEIKVDLSNSVGNAAPVAVTDNNFIFPDDIAIGNLLDNDNYPDGNVNLITVATSPVVNPLNGKVQIEPNGIFIYTPNAGFIGRDKFQYRICNNRTPSLCDSAWVYIFVNTYIEDERQPSVNDPDYSSGVEVLAGNDTIIGNCNPIKLNGSLNGTEGFKYLWEPSALLDNPNIPTPLFTTGTTTTFKLKVTDIYGFSMSDEVLITVSDVIANAGEDIYMEQNSTVILDGTKSSGEGLQFTWTTIDGNIDSGVNTA